MIINVVWPWWEIIICDLCGARRRWDWCEWVYVCCGNKKWHDCDIVYVLDGGRVWNIKKSIFIMCYLLAAVEFPFIWPFEFSSESRNTKEYHASKCTSEPNRHTQKTHEMWAYRQIFEWMVTSKCHKEHFFHRRLLFYFIFFFFSWHYAHCSSDYAVILAFAFFRLSFLSLYLSAASLDVPLSICFFFVYLYHLCLRRFLFFLLLLLLLSSFFFRLHFAFSRIHFICTRIFFVICCCGRVFVLVAFFFFLPVELLT